MTGRRIQSRQTPPPHGRPDRPPRTLQDLVMGAAEVSGMPRLGNAKTGHLRGYHSRTEPVQLWDGSNGKVGYLSYLAQQRTWVFAKMLGLILKHNPRMIVPPPKNAEPISQRAELEGRGLNLRYFLHELMTLRRRPRTSMNCTPNCAVAGWNSTSP